MANRAGPPTPRTDLRYHGASAEPRLSPEPHTPAPYAERDEFCRNFLLEGRFTNRYNSMVIAAIKDGFNAGWAARKQAEYNLVVGQKKSVDKRHAIPDTLFPTTGEMT